MGACKYYAVTVVGMIFRSGIQVFLEDSRCGLFETVVAEVLNRVNRDQTDLATSCIHLRFAVVIIVSLWEGEINELHVGLKGALNALP